MHIYSIRKHVLLLWGDKRVVLSIKGILAIIISSIIISIGVNFFLVPFRILDGGIIGLSLIINYLTGLKIGFTIVLFSFPIYLFSWFKYRKFFYNSILGLLVSSFFIDLLYPYQFYFTYYIQLTSTTSSIIGGVLIGIGIGLMLRNNTSVSGTDMLAQIISNLLTINVGVIIFLLDFMVIVLGGILISIETLYLSILAITSVGIATSVVTINHSFISR